MTDMRIYGNFLLRPLLFFIVHSSILAEGKKIFCYYSSFAQTRQGIGNFLPEDINPHLCTHLIYAFVDITPDGRDLMPFSRNDHGPKGLYARTLALKEKNPSLKVLLAVGGWQIGSKPFIPMVRDESNRRTWIRNVVAYVRKHGFDGFDMDWEFPATRGSPPEDRYRFTLLMKGLYEAFQKEAAETGREKLLLTLAAASGTYYIDQSYEPDKIIHYIDYMFLMTYNYHGQWEKITGHHSGLYPHKDDPKTGEKSQLYQQWSIDYWLDVGIPKSKLVVGLPTYGMSFTLANPTDHGVHTLVSGGGRMGDYTREIGILSYYEICMNLRDKGWKSVWIEEQSAPYAYGGDQWAGYENKASITIKANNIESRDLAGAFVWSVEMDDYRGTCGEGKYPLLSTIHDILGDDTHSSVASQWIRPQTASHSWIERQTLRYQTPSAIPTITSQYGNNAMRRRKFKRLQKWNKILAAAAAHRGTVASMPASRPTVAAKKNPPTTKRRHRIRWWNRPLRRKTITWKPWTEMSKKPVNNVPKKPASPVSKRPKYTWLKKGTKKQSYDSDASDSAENEINNSKMANELASYEVHEVNSWKAARWWSSAKGWDGDQGISQLIAHATGRPGMGVQKIIFTSPATPTVRQTYTKPPVPRKTFTKPSSSPKTYTKPSSPRKTYTKPSSPRKTYTKPSSPRKTYTKPSWPRKTYKKSHVTWQTHTKPHEAWQTHTKSHVAWQTHTKPHVNRQTHLRPSVVHQTHTNPPETTPQPNAAGATEIESKFCRDVGVGTFADPRSCDHFIICMPGSWLDYPPHVMACPAGTRFDSSLKICNYASQVHCHL